MKRSGKTDKKKLNDKLAKELDVIHAPFPAKDLAHPEKGTPVLEPVPELPPNPLPFSVKCKVTSVSTHFWSGICFTALEATDGQNLLDFLRQGQEVEIHYKPST